MLVRRYRDQDGERLTEIYRTAVLGIGRVDYSEQQVTAWAGLAPSSADWAAFNRDGRVMLVASGTDGQAQAFGDLEADGHIHFLYCHPDHAGTGMVSTLYDALESLARRRGMGRLYAEASEAARRFFAKKRFEILGRRELTVAGVGIHNYAVAKTIKG
jgi:putative acetyltransferase